MSANNIWIIQKVGDKYYGWDEMAEESFYDRSSCGRKRILCAKTCVASAQTIEELESKMQEFSALGYAEYGVTLRPFLPDGTPIEVME